MLASIMIYFISQLFVVYSLLLFKKSAYHLIANISMSILISTDYKAYPNENFVVDKILASIFISSAKYLNQKYLFDAEHEPFVSGEHLVRGGRVNVDLWL